MEVHVHMNQESMVALNAIVIWGARGGDRRIATIHPMSDDARPEVKPGRLMTESDLNGLVKSMAMSASNRLVLMDDKVLAGNGQRLIWWTPPAKRAIFFAGNAVDGAAIVAVPGLVWQTNGSALWVWALDGRTRPTAATILFQAPFFNVNSQGRVCIGNAQVPSESQAFSPNAWEEMFFGSKFTHPNVHEPGKLMKTSPIQYWKRQLQRPSAKFNINNLVATGATLGDLLNKDCLS